jgi:hypothetical protein
MDLENIYFVAEIVGVIALILSLLFVGLQVRQNTKATKIATSTATIDNWIDISRDFSLNGEMSELWVRGEDWNSLSKVDHYRLFVHINAAFRSLELSYLHWIDGNLDDRLWHGTQSTFQLWINGAQPMAVWKDAQRAASSAEFAQYVDSLIAKNEAAQSTTG